MLTKFISLKEVEGAFYSVLNVSHIYDEKIDSSQELLEKLEDTLENELSNSPEIIALDISNIGTNARNMLFYAANVREDFPRTFILPLNKKITDVVGAIDGERNRIKLFDLGALG